MESDRLEVVFREESSAVLGGWGAGRKQRDWSQQQRGSEEMRDKTVTQREEGRGEHLLFVIPCQRFTSSPWSCWRRGGKGAGLSRPPAPCVTDQTS